MLPGFHLIEMSERLILRQWRQSDLKPLAELNANPRVREYFHEDED